MATLREQATALGIIVDNRWSDETIQAKIDQAKPKAAPVKGVAPVRLVYAWWDDDGNRCDAGEIVEMPVEVARALIASGKAERTDPLPGE